MHKGGLIADPSAKDGRMKMSHADNLERLSRNPEATVEPRTDKIVLKRRGKPHCFTSNRNLRVCISAVPVA